MTPQHPKPSQGTLRARNFLLGLTAAQAFLLVACSSNKPAPNDSTVVTPTLPIVVTAPKAQRGLEGQTATFSVQATGTGLTYQWQRNGADLPGATASAYTTPVLGAADEGARYRVIVKNDAGSVTSSEAVLTVVLKPSIQTDPVATLGLEGKTANFTVQAKGTDLTYQWQRNNTDIQGANTASYTTPVLTPADHGTTFRVVVKNDAGSVTSAPATLSVTARPVIRQAPTAQRSTEGKTATFTVLADGTGLTYQWQRNGADIQGANSNSYTTLPLGANDDGAQFSVIVTNAAGSVSTPAVGLTVVASPRITQAPTATTGFEGKTATFTVQATGTGLSYQWLRDGAAIPQATLATYTTPVLTAADQGATFSVTVKNDAGEVTSAVATLTVVTKPVVNVAPAAQRGLEGKTATFTVQATGPDLTYQWLRDGQAIQGATLASYTTPSLLPTDDGAQFSVTVANTAGSFTTAPVSLAVVAKPTLTQEPASTAIEVGQNATFTVQAGGTAPFTYQWFRGGAPINGATQASYTLSGAVAGDNGATFRVTVTNEAGSITSGDATLTVNQGANHIVITQAPTTQDVIAPARPTFTVKATGANLTYQWRQNGADLAGKTTDTLVLDETDLFTVPGSYSVIVKNGTEQVETPAATFTVKTPAPLYPGAGVPTPKIARPITVLSNTTPDPVHFPEGAFKFGYDEALKNPIWTAYAEYRASKLFINSDGDYAADNRLEIPRVEKTSMGTHGSMFYLSTGKGFDRGHMVTRSNISYLYGTSIGDEATYMSNLIPQVSAFNQGLWNDLETVLSSSGTLSADKTYTTVTKQGLGGTMGRLWVYTGPIFPNTIDWWIPSQNIYLQDLKSLAMGTLAIATPTACYKILVAEPTVPEVLPRVLAWVGPNSPDMPKGAANLWPYVTSVKRVEDLTGIDFFPSFAANAATPAWKATVDVRGWGTTFEQATAPNVHIVQPSWDLVPFSGNPILKGFSVNTGDVVTFEGAATPAKDSTATLQTPTWSFGDGATATGFTATHVYSAANTYTVSFTATDTANNTKTITRKITVYDAGANKAPVVGALADVQVRKDTPVPVINLSLADDQTPVEGLQVTVTAADPGLLPPEGIVLGTLGASTPLTLTPTVGQVGTTLVTVAVSDGTLTTTRTFTLKVVANAAPTLTSLSTLPVMLQPGNTATVQFTATDDLDTPTLSYSSSNTGLLKVETLAPATTGNTTTLTIAPEAGQTGDATVTVTATDTEGGVSTLAIPVKVQTNAGTPEVMITQYYEGASNDKWLEISNVGTGAYTNTGDGKLYLYLWVNPYNATGGSWTVTELAPISAGGSILYKNAGSALPTLTNITGAYYESTITYFNGDDILFLSPVAPVATATLPTTPGATVSPTNGPAAYAGRVDVIGVNDVSWTGTSTTSTNTSYALCKGANRSYVRNSGVVKGNAAFTFGEWTVVDAKEITNTQISAVTTAATGTNIRLGEHKVTPN